MRLRTLVFTASAAALLLLALGWCIPTAVQADDTANPAEKLVWEDVKTGFKWTKPNEPEWGWIPEEKWGSIFEGGKKPDDMACGLVKYMVPGGQWGKDNHKIFILVRFLAADGKYKFGDKDMDGGNVKGICQFMCDSEKERYKDLKGEKGPAPVKYKFDSKVISFSFTGINKQNGGTGFKQGLVWKGNSKYTFQVTIDCPSVNEKQVRIELDRVLNQIEVGKPGK